MSIRCRRRELSGRRRAFGSAAPVPTWSSSKSVCGSVVQTAEALTLGTGCSAQPGGEPDLLSDEILANLKATRGLFIVHWNVSFPRKRKNINFINKTNSWSLCTCVKSGTGSSSSNLDINSHTSISRAVSNFEPKWSGKHSCKEEMEEWQGVDCYRFFEVFYAEMVQGKPVDVDQRSRYRQSRKPECATASYSQSRNNFHTLAV